MDIMDIFSTYALIDHRPLGDKGEDAYAFDFAHHQFHVQAVFDGCGGAGAWKYPEFKNATGAFVAAQMMAGTFQHWCTSLTLEMLSNPSLAADSFHSAAEQSLQDCKAKCAPMGVTGSLVKAFPCTATISIQEYRDPHHLQVTALNAGDSRVYILTPQDGLLQFTKDDSRGNPDPLESLRDSVPLSNLLNADKPFRITPSSVTVPLPCAIICATDGMFGFFRSPMDFEYILLDTLVHARTIHEFEDNFKKRVVEVTGDDSTCIASFYGFHNMNEVRTKMNGRYKQITQMIQDIDHAGRERAAVEAAIYQQWSTYKQQTIMYEWQG